MGVIIFDMDGTLVNSQLAHAAAFNLAFKKNNLRIYDTKTLLDIFGPPAEKVVKILFPSVSGRKLKAVVNDKEQFLLDETYKLVKPISGAANALSILKKKYKLALVTNAKHEGTFLLLKKGGIDARIFDVIIASNDLPAQKPDPAVVKKVERILKDRVVYVVGDRVEDVKLAKNCGAKAVAMDFGSDDPNDLSSAGADYIVKSITLLPELLL